MTSEIGKWIIIVALGLLVIGILIYFFHDKLGWIGNLPGDIKIERENFNFYMPITTLIIANLLLVGLIRVIRQFLN